MSAHPPHEQPDGASVAVSRLLATLDAVTTAVSEAGSLAEVLERALGTVVEITGVDGGGIYLFDETSGDLRLAVHRGISAQFAESFARNPGTTVWRLATDPDAAVIVADVSQAEHRPEVAQEDIRSFVGIPLQARGQSLGALVAITHARYDFQATTVDLLVSIGKQIGIAIDRARLFERERRRAQQLETISEVGRRLGTILTERELLRQVVHYVREHLGYESANLFLIDPSTGEVVLEAASGLGKEALMGYRLAPNERSIVAWVAANNEPLLANDVTREPRFMRAGSEDVSRAELAVPIRTGNGVLGVLDVQSSHANAFHEMDISALQTLAGQIAVAIENARLYEDTQRALRRTRAFQEVSTAITSSLNLGRTLEHALEAAMGVFAADRAGIYLIDPYAGRVQCAASHNLSSAYIEAVHRYYHSQPGPPDFLQARRSIYIENAQTAPLVPELREAIRREGFVSMLFLPLVHGETALGTFVLYHDRVRRYTDEEITLAQTFGNQAAIAIRHAWLFQAERRAREQASVILDATRAIASSLDLDDVLTEAARCIAEALRQRYCGIWLMDESGASLVPWRVVANPPDEQVVSAFHHLPAIPVSEDSPLQWLFREGQAVIREEREDLTELEAIIQHLVPFRSYMAVPFIARDRLLGMAAVPVVEAGYRFNPDEVAVATAIARSTALAVENARLYGQSQRLAVSEERNRLARELHDSVTQSLFSMTLITQALPKILDRDVERARERIERLNELGRGALAEMRALIFELRPAALEDEGLAAALTKHTAAFQSREGITVDLHIEGERRLAPQVEEGIFRVAQEALNNVAKHARARHVTVRLEMDDAFARLTVQDDGIGFDGAAPGPDRRTLGMTSMRERATLLGGTCTVDGAPGQGTTVRFRVPLHIDL